MGCTSRVENWGYRRDFCSAEGLRTQLVLLLPEVFASSRFMSAFQSRANVRVWTPFDWDIVHTVQGLPVLPAEALGPGRFACASAGCSAPLSTKNGCCAEATSFDQLFNSGGNAVF